MSFPEPESPWTEELQKEILIQGLPLSGGHQDLIGMRAADVNLDAVLDCTMH